MKTAPPKLSKGTESVIRQIENDEVRELLLKGLHPAEVIEGWYYALSSGILRIQGGKCKS